MKKTFLLITIIAVTLFSSVGCITKQVWKEKTKTNFYDETVVAFYANPKSSELAFIGEKYHYIFKENTKPFTRLLNNKAFLNLKQSHLRIHSFIDREDNRIVHASIFVRYPIKGTNPQQIAWVEKNGFVKHTPPYLESQMKIEEYSRHYAIKGTRYIANGEVNKKSLKLRTPITLKVEDYTIEEKSTLYKIAMTPISLTGDAVGGLLMLGAVIVMSPVWLYQQIIH